MSQWPRRTVDKSGEKPVETMFLTSHKVLSGSFPDIVLSDSTLSQVVKDLPFKEIERLSTNPHALLLLIYNYLKTEEARPFLLSAEVERAMQVFVGVPESVRRAAGVIVLLGRLHDGGSRTTEEGSVPS